MPLRHILPGRENAFASWLSRPRARMVSTLLAASCFSLALAQLAAADTLGDARQLSRLGEPLRLSILIRSDTGPRLEERCLSIASPPQSDGLPHILTANVALEREGGVPVAVSVSTAAAMREPVVRLLLRTSCDGSTRQYTLFLEPAGSTRQMRAVGQPGPRVGASAASGGAPTGQTMAAASGGPAGATSTGSPASGGSGTPVVTVIPVIPSPERTAPTAAREPMRSSPPPAARPEAPAPAATPRAERTSPPSATAGGEPSGARSDPASEARTPEPGSVTQEAAVLEAENARLREQLAMLSGELQRLQAPAPPAPVAAPARAAANPTGAAIPPRWNVAWPVLVALAGLAALTVGGFMWRRRHHAADEWALTGPPSHRMASRTSLAEDPVPFKQVGVREGASNDETIPGAAVDRPRAGVSPPLPPLPLLVQPSTDDLARELEQEIFIAERAHSALERAHPEVVDVLTRSWGTAAARQHLARLLDPASVELARMSGESVAELRLLQRIAEEGKGRNGELPQVLRPSATA